MLQAARKGMWKASEQQLTALAGIEQTAAIGQPTADKNEEKGMVLKKETLNAGSEKRNTLSNLLVVGGVAAAAVAIVVLRKRRKEREEE